MGCGASASTAKKASEGSDAKAEPKSGGGADKSKTSTKSEQQAPCKNFVVENTGKIANVYEVEKKKLGEGSYGYVCKAKHKGTSSVRAVKTISKGQIKDINRIKSEILIMSMMDHPNIVKLYEKFEDHRNIYLVMELCAGGELFDRIIETGHFAEFQAAIIMQQIIRAIFYMHQQHICHRDLKPENFLFHKKDSIQKSLLKIIDFGLSCNFKAGQVLTTKAGTPYYVSPQVLAGKYDQSSDLWSCGAIMFVLLCGYPPFYGDTDGEVLQRVKAGNFTFNASDWKNVSDDAKDLIRNLLKMNPKERFTAEQTLNHDWIKNKAPKASNVALQSSLVDNLRSFRGANKLKKKALHIIAGQLGESQIVALREMFMSLDSDGDGSLTVKELKEGLNKSGIKDIPNDLQQIMDQVDSDGSGAIDYTEFLAATLDQKQYLREDVCWNAFQVFDRDGNGKITRDELKLVLNNGSVEDACGAQAIEALLSDVDKNGDGEIDFAEFMQMMQEGKISAP